MEYIDCMERIPKQENFKIEQLNLEKEANFEGNHALLYYERLKNPEIKRQLIDLLYNYYLHREPIPVSYIDEHGNLVRKESEKPEPKSKEQIEKELEEGIEKVFSVTALNYDPKGTSTAGSIEINGEWIDSGTIAFRSNNFNTGEPWTKQQLSIIEAHEKGHGVRGSFPLVDKETRGKIAACLDFSQVNIDSQIIAKWREINANTADPDHLDNLKNKKDEEIKEEILEYFSEPGEIIERMAQLKNYFGMTGNQKFTKQHLDYAKQHYTQDTGMGIQMKPFLDAITPEKEELFLELINSLGV